VSILPCRRPRYRNYEQELQKHSLSGEETDNHPLQGIVTVSMVEREGGGGGAEAGRC